MILHKGDFVLVVPIKGSDKVDFVTTVRLGQDYTPQTTGLILVEDAFGWGHEIPVEHIQIESEFLNMTDEELSIFEHKDHFDLGDI